MKNHSINVDKEIKNYALRADGIDAGDAMDVLIRMYLDNCGISLTDRTLAENAIHFWIARWQESHSELSKNTGLYDMMVCRDFTLTRNRFLTHQTNHYYNDIAEAKLSPLQCLTTFFVCISR